MGNSVDKDGSPIEGFEDIYDTLAKGFTYTKCDETDDSNPVLLRPPSSSNNAKQRKAKTRSVIVKSSSSLTKARKPVRRTSLCAVREGDTFLLSDMEVQVNGKVAK